MKPLWALDGRGMQALTILILAFACCLPLLVQWLPVNDLAQLVAVSRMFVELNDPQLGYASWYELALQRSPMYLPLFLTGWLAKLGTPALAGRVIAFAAVSSYALGLCALLRALQKPLSLALVGVPLLYASPFFLGLIPSCISAGLALLVIAQLIAPGPLARLTVPLLCSLIVFTHPFGFLIVSGFCVAVLMNGRRSELQLPWLSLTPLALGALAWIACWLAGEGTATFSYPSPLLRILRFSDQILGGFAPRGEGYLLLATLTLLVLLRRSVAIRNVADRALLLLVAAAALGYAVLPASTQSITAIHSRAGWLALALAPALLPTDDPRGLRERTPLLLLALALVSTWFTCSNLRAFDEEARSFEPVLQHIRNQPRLVGMIYDNRGHVAARAAYASFPAWAQAERGGFLSLSLLDSDWTIPLRRKADTEAPPALQGSDVDPALLQTQPLQFEFYDSVLVRGKDAREMTIFMGGRLQLAAESGKWLLYTTP